MVFLIQNTQSRDILTVQLILSELVLAVKGAQNKFAAIEHLTDAELEELHQQRHARAKQTLDHLERRRKTTSSPGPLAPSHKPGQAPPSGKPS